MVRAKLIKNLFFKPCLKVLKSLLGGKIQNLGYDGLSWSTLRSYGWVNCVWVWQMHSYTSQISQNIHTKHFLQSLKIRHIYTRLLILHSVLHYRICLYFV